MYIHTQTFRFTEWYPNGRFSTEALQFFHTSWKGDSLIFIKTKSAQPASWKLCQMITLFWYGRTKNDNVPCTSYLANPYGMLSFDPFCKVNVQPTHNHSHENSPSVSMKFDLILARAHPHSHGHNDGFIQSLIGKSTRFRRNTWIHLNTQLSTIVSCS